MPINLSLFSFYFSLFSLYISLSLLSCVSRFRFWSFNVEPRAISSTLFHSVLYDVRSCRVVFCSVLFYALIYIYIYTRGLISLRLLAAARSLYYKRRRWYTTTCDVGASWKTQTRPSVPLYASGQVVTDLTISSLPRKRTINNSCSSVASSSQHGS